MAEVVLDLEDLAGRYDAQVLREYLLHRQDAASTAAGARAGGVVQQLEIRQAQPWPEAHDLKPSSFRLLRTLLALNFFAYWATVVCCTYVYYFRILEYGMGALPPLYVGLLGVFMLGTQSTLEFAAAACLAQPAQVAAGAPSLGFRGWDGMAWLAGASARAAVLLDAMCLPLMRYGSSLLFLLSVGTFMFAIGLFVFTVQLRLLVGLFCTQDRFSYDKPDLFFRGRDIHGMVEGTPIAARPPARRDEDHLELPPGYQSPPVNAIKAANCAHFSDLSLLHAVISRIYIPLSCQGTQEFVISATSFSRCFCEDIVQCSVKFFFLMDFDMNLLVLLSLVLSSAQAVASCFYSSTPAMDFTSVDTAMRE